MWIESTNLKSACKTAMFSVYMWGNALVSFGYATVGNDYTDDDELILRMCTGKIINSFAV